jgi:hypothetical protein
VVKIAHDQLTSLTQAGLIEGVKLHPYSEIKFTVADWYFDLDEDLPKLLDEGINDLRNRLQSEGQFLGEISVRTVTLKGNPRVVGTCWVGMHICQ